MVVITTIENVQNLCPVCGYEMDDPPRDCNICASCGTEFGVHDLNASILELRQAWIKTGPKWWSTTDPQPESWNPFAQLARLGISGAVVTGTAVYQMVSTTATHVQISRGWLGWAEMVLQPSVDRQLALGYK